MKLLAARMAYDDWPDSGQARKGQTNGKIRTPSNKIVALDMKVSVAFPMNWSASLGAGLQVWQPMGAGIFSPVDSLTPRPKNNKSRTILFAKNAVNGSYVCTAPGTFQNINMLANHSSRLRQPISRSSNANGSWRRGASVSLAPTVAGAEIASAA